MDVKLLVTTFGAIFLAELGDKTQLATMALATSAESRWAVFLGAALALVATSALAVLFGGAISKVVPEEWMRRIAGGIFIILGIFYVAGIGE